MSGERFNNQNMKYGTLIMRPYVIFGNDIAAFFDVYDNLIFVLDNTLNVRKPNVLLVINPDGDKKWDEILSNKYKLDLETIRPKQDNKYQKLDIEYSGLNVYENLIKAYDAGNELSDYLMQLEILRDSAARHSAVSRLNMANEIIAKTNNTIVKTKETISDLQNRLKTLRSKLSAQKKEIGKISTKQSAAKILRTESQIEATNEKLKRAKKRLESAQRRLETATNDAEMASDLLNQPESKYTAPVSKPVVVAPKYEVQTTEPEVEPENYDDDSQDDQEDEEEYASDSVKPLFDTDPNILNEDIAFKPISFDVSESEVEQSTPVIDFEEGQREENLPEKTEDFIAPVPFESEPIVEEQHESNDLPPIINTQALFDLDKKSEDSSHEEDEMTEEKAKSVLESMTPVYDYEEPLVSEQEPINVRPVEEGVRESEPTIQPIQEIKEPEVPVVHPVENTFNAPVNDQKEHSKPTFAYYFLLIVLVLLSVFTLWLYQKSMGNGTPVLTKKAAETVFVEEKQQPKQAVVEQEDNSLPEIVEEEVFLDEQPEPQPVKKEPVVEPEPVEEEVTEPVVEPELEQPIEEFQEPEPGIEETEDIVEEQPVEEEQETVEEQQIEEPVEEIVQEETVVDKPEYDAGSKHEEMFIIENENTEESSYEDADFVEEDPFYDAEEVEYQAEGLEE